MKSIQLKTLNPEDPIEKLDYKEIIIIIAKSPNIKDGRQQGITIEEVRDSMRIIDAVEKATDTLTLEDSDFSHLMKKAKGFPWAKASKSIVEFMDDLEKAEEAK